MDAATNDVDGCIGISDVKNVVKRKTLTSQTIKSNFATSTTDDNCSQHSQSENVSAREVAIQANDYDIERTSSHLPSRKRYVPLKFSDYRVFAGGSQVEEKEEEEEEDEDLTFDPDKKVQKVSKAVSGRRRGRPRKNAVAADGVKQDALEKKTTIIKVPTGFKCSICGRIFSLRGNAKAHIITHTDQRPFACDFEGCGKQLRTKEGLRRHQLSHLGIKMFECLECKKKFSSNASLLEHMARHTGEKPLTCKVCGLKFRQVAVLKRHITTHSDDKPFACGACGKRFAMKIYVQSHMKTHTGERPFTCDTCNKSFAHASDLNRHKIIHTGKKPYACSVCTMRFSDASSRRRHEREHQGKQQYICHLCDQHFTRAGQLRNHLMREHNSETEPLFEVQEGEKEHQEKWSANENVSKIVNSTQNIPPHSIVQENDILGREDQVSNILGDIVSSPASVKVVRGVSQQVSNGSKENSEAVGEIDDPKSVNISEPVISLEDSANIQPGCTFTIIGQNDNSQIFELHLENGSQIPFEELAGRISLGDIHFQADDTSLTFIKQENNVYTVFQQPQTCPVVNLPSEHIISSSDQWQVDPNLSHQLQNNHLIKYIQKAKDDTATNKFPISKVAVESMNVESKEVTVNVNSDDTLCNRNMSENSHLPDIQTETLNLSAVKSETTPTFSTSQNYIFDPDLNSQDYYNWLSTFTEECKILPMPLNKSMFQKISHVQKTLSDFMALPSGVISDKNNFKVLMSITRELSDIIDRHLDLMLQNLS